MACKCLMTRPKKKWLKVGGFLIILTTGLTLWLKEYLLRYAYNPTQYFPFLMPFTCQSFDEISKAKALRKHPLILYWGYPWGVVSAGEPEGEKIGECLTTYNRSKYCEADAVVFHYTTIGSKDMPWRYYRDPNQIFVWWSAEGPAVLKTSHYNLDDFDGFFNWTWTYRRDADVLRNYGYRGDMLNAVSKGKKAVDDVIAQKTKLAIWIVSQCDYTYGARLRMNYSKKLAEAGMNFTAYGKCFRRPLPRHGKSVDAIVKQYKFYFAFENALHCTDYITEKFWNKALLTGTVPVVWGPKKKDMLEVAPLDSFIFVEDFESPKELAEYLKFLDTNDDEYRKYFRWREDETMTDEKMIELTKERYPDLNIQVRPETICEKLVKNNETKIIHSMMEEFWNRNVEECLEEG